MTDAIQVALKPDEIQAHMGMPPNPSPPGETQHGCHGTGELRVMKRRTYLQNLT